MSNQVATKTSHSFLLLIGVLFIGLCLRGPITSIAPIIDLIKEQFQLNTVQLSMLTTLPLIVFAVMSPFASRIGMSFGIERTLFLSLILIIFGSFVRSSTSVSLLFIGTIIIGGGIALANVLLPSLLKQSFPQNITSVTSAYVLMMGLGATISAGVSFPLADYANTIFIPLPNWAFSLLCLIIIPTIALALWLPQLQVKNHGTAKKSGETHKYIWKSREAWNVTLYLGLSLLLLYIFIAWFPSILIENGYSKQEAGFLHSFLQFSSIFPAFVLNPLLKKLPNKRVVLVALMLITTCCILGLLVSPNIAIIWSGLIGFSLGGSLIIAMSQLSHKAQNSEQSAALSGMAQCIAYSIAASGPVLMGVTHSLSGSWTIPLLTCAILGLLGSYYAFIVSNDTVIPIKESPFYYKAERV